MNKYYFSLLALLMFLVSCTKSTSDPDTGAILRTGKWRISSASIRMKLPSGKDTTMDYVQFIPKCRVDDYLRFQTLTRGAVYNGGTSCSASDADSTTFQWLLKENGTVVDIYNGFTLIDSVAQTILTPYHFDTISQSPILVLDTISNDPANIVLDTVWDLNFRSVPSPTFNIYNAHLSNVSQSTFSMDFAFRAQYPDSTHFNEVTPILRPDSFHYHIVYSNF